MTGTVSSCILHPPPSHREEHSDKSQSNRRRNHPQLGQCWHIGFEISYINKGAFSETFLGVLAISVYPALNFRDDDSGARFTEYINELPSRRVFLYDLGACTFGETASRI